MDTKIFTLIADEENRQKHTIRLIASENFTSAAVRAAEGSILTNKYSEGYPKKRYYQGQKNTDDIEQICIDRAKKLFGANFANVQPHSGSSANFAIYTALLNPGDKILGLKLSHGGHLTHGHSVSATSTFWQTAHFGVENDGKINYDKLHKIAKQEKPQIIVTGGTAYPWQIDFARVRAIADEIGAFYLADISHEAGLVAAGLYDNPANIADVTMFTTHKTLRGPRHAVILSKNEAIAKKINRAIFPGLQGGPMMHTIAATATALHEATQPEFKTYAQNVIDNAKTLADTLRTKNYKIIGTQTHLVLVRVGTDAKNIATALETAGIVTNANTVPGDEKPLYPTGIRLGTAAMTTRGVSAAGWTQIADFFDRAVKNYQNPKTIANIRTEVEKFCREI